MPSDAEHTEAAPLPSETHGSNPLPRDAEHVPAPEAATHSDSNPLPGSITKAESKPASNDLLIPAVGYVFGLLALISLMGQNAKAKFHGAQAILYSIILVALYMPVLIVTGILGFMGGIVALLGLAVLLAYGLLFLVPLYMAYKTFTGADVMLPVIGRFAADKVGYKP